MTNTSLAAQAVAGHLVVPDALSASIAAGSRLALILFAVMSGLAWIKNRGEVTALERWRRRGWMFLSIAALAASPLRAALFLGFAISVAAENITDAIATSACSACFICSLASRGLMRGMSEQRVRRGVIANVVVLLAFVGAAAWLNR